MFSEKSVAIVDFSTILDTCISHFPLYLFFFSLISHFPCHLVGRHIYASLTLPAIDCPSRQMQALTSYISSHEKFWEQFGVHRRERADIPQGSYNWAKFCITVCKSFLLFTHTVTAISAKVLPEQ